jgi:hypothetical protein
MQCLAILLHLEVSTDVAANQKRAGIENDVLWKATNITIAGNASDPNTAGILMSHEMLCW